MDVGNRLKKVREALGLSQNELANEISSSQGVISGIENGYKKLSRSLIEKLSENFLDVNITWLISGNGNMLLYPPTPGERLAYFRHDREIPAEMMASMSDITLEEYEAFEKNDKDPPEHLLKKWEGNFRLSSRWLIAGKGSMYLDPEDIPEKNMKVKEIKMIVNEDDGELSWQQQFPGVFRMYQENKRLKDRVNGSGCSVCKIMRSLDAGRQNRVTGYAEALLQEQQQETDSDTEK